MTEKNTLTYAMRDVDKIVWTKTVDGLNTTYVSKAPVYVPYGKYSREIIGDINIVLIVVKSAFSDEILTVQFVDSAVFSKTKNPIRGESIIFSTIEQVPVIRKIPGTVDKYNVFFKNGTNINVRADFSQSLGDFSNWAGTGLVEYKDNDKYFIINYSNYLGTKFDL
jgi:hypothetical protein